MGITIKGITVPALLVKLDKEQSLKENIAQMEEKLSSTVLKGSMAMVSYDEMDLGEEDKGKIEEVLSRHNARFLGYKPIDGIEAGKPKTALSGIKEKSLKIINKQIRSGQRVEHTGDILVIGDVNPDSYVIASGNVIVMGTLRGIVHAGASGDETVTVMALKLRPQQLRIGSYITRSPDEPDTTEYPEKAHVRENQIIIEKI